MRQTTGSLAMTAKQRVLAAAYHRPSDRTPSTFDAEKEVYDTAYEYRPRVSGDRAI